MSTEPNKSIGVWKWATVLAANQGYELRLNIGGGRSAALVPKEGLAVRAAHNTLVFPTGMEAVHYLEQHQ